MFWTYPPKHFTQFCGIRFPWLDFYTLSTVASDKPIARFESLVGGKYIFKGQCFCYCVFETYFRTQQNFGVHWPRTPPYGSGFSGKSSAPRYVAKLLWEINDFYIVENVSPHTRATPPVRSIKAVTFIFVNWLYVQHVVQDLALLRFRTKNPYRTLLPSWVWENCRRKRSSPCNGPGRSKDSCRSPSRSVLGPSDASKCAVLFHALIHWLVGCAGRRDIHRHARKARDAQGHNHRF